MTELKIKIGGHYRDGAGKIIQIAGAAKHNSIEGQPIYWSNDGHWYAEDGRFCSYGQRGTVDGEQRYGHSLLPFNCHRTLVCETTEEE